MTRRQMGWMGWLLFLLVWTALLLRPEPAQIPNSVVPSYWRYPIAKTVHVTAYAILFAWGRYLARTSPNGSRGIISWWPLLILSLHGFLTEYLQTMVRLRTGSIADVAWDHLGIFLGFLVGLYLQRKEKSPPLGETGIKEPDPKEN